MNAATDDLSSTILDIARTSDLRLRRAALNAAVNELELQIRQLCEKQQRALALAHQIEELIAEERGS